MFRPKLRPDWIVRSYAFRAWMIEEDNPVIWEHAQLVSQAWNEMVTVYHNWEEKILRINAEINNFKRESHSAMEEDEVLKNALSELIKKRLQFYKERKKEIEESLAKAAGLGAPDKEYLHKSFERAVESVRQRGGVLKYKSSIKSIHFYHRYSAGGSAVSTLMKSLAPEKKGRKSRKKDPGRPRQTVSFKLLGDDEKGRLLAEGIFRVGEQRHPLKFKVLLHRKLPNEAFIKEIHLFASPSPAKGLLWQIIFIIELPPDEIIFKSYLPAAAIDLGWRKIEDYLRVGVIADTHGNFYELRLPLNDGENREIRKLRRYLERQGKRMYQTPLSHAELFEWREKIDSHLSAVKDILWEEYATGRLPPELNIYLEKYLDKIRDNGLSEILKIVKTELYQNIDENHGNFYERLNKETRSALLRIEKSILDLFDEKKENERRAALFRERWIRRRDTIYRQISKWLAENFVHLVWEENFRPSVIGIRSAQMSIKNEAALLRSGKYRNIAAVSHLLKFLKERPGFLLSGDQSNTSTLCFDCKGEIVTDLKKLNVVCKNGHQFDQDVLASLNLLSQLPDDIAHSKAGGSAVVPQHLQKYIVRL